MSEKRSRLSNGDKMAILEAVRTWLQEAGHNGAIQNQSKKNSTIAVIPLAVNKIASSGFFVPL